MANFNFGKNFLAVHAKGFYDISIFCHNIIRLETLSLLFQTVWPELQDFLQFLPSFRFEKSLKPVPGDQRDNSLIKSIVLFSYVLENPLTFDLRAQFNLSLENERPPNARKPFIAFKTSMYYFRGQTVLQIIPFNFELQNGVPYSRRVILDVIGQIIYFFQFEKIGTRCEFYHVTLVKRKTRILTLVVDPQ